MYERVTLRRRHAVWREYGLKACKPTRRSPMNTRTIAIVALIIAVILLIIFLM